uniref:Uncharacterized protein n=1 Tax=Nelumbo nucifera TaxID=4432 RepID=A0A822Z257_NELNU|nr:TPA_asm: hypothetical protein HUJ06_012905 [Nelumbo nucifera]
MLLSACAEPESTWPPLTSMREEGLSVSFLILSFHLWHVKTAEERMEVWLTLLPIY